MAKAPPLQPRSWQLWQQALQAIFLTPSLTTERKLRQTLGSWDHNISAKWKWFYSAVEDRVYHFEGMGWRVFSKITSRVQRLRSIAPTTPDDEVVMASISRTRDGVRITGVNILLSGSTPPSEITSRSILGALGQHDEELDKWSV
jgi:hypothetical protein